MQCWIQVTLFFLEQLVSVFSAVILLVAIAHLIMYPLQVSTQEVHQSFSREADFILLSFSLAAPHPETLNLGPVSNLNAIIMGTNSAGWTEAFVSWGFPNSTYHYIVSFFIINYYQVVEVPEGWRLQGTHSDSKTLSLVRAIGHWSSPSVTLDILLQSSDKQYQKTDTFNITLELISNKFYMIGVCLHGYIEVSE